MNSVNKPLNRLSARAATFALLALTAGLAQVSPALISPALAQANSVSYTDLLLENGGDLDPNHWASTQIRELVDKYGAISGFPDHKFRGDRTLSRFEMAAALFQVLNYVDAEVVRLSQRQCPGCPASTAELQAEFRTLQALSAEFKTELDQLKATQGELSQRVETLARVRVHGLVELRYRERAAVTDGTQSNSPLFGPGNSSPTAIVTQELATDTRTPSLEFVNNLGEFSRDLNGQPTSFNSPMEASITPDDLALFRLHTQLGVDAMLTDELSVSTGFDTFELGNLMNGAPLTNGGHNLTEGSASGNPFVFRQALLQYGAISAPSSDLSGTPTDLGYGSGLKLGLLNFGSDLNPHTRLANHFGQQGWMGHGYGLVGWGGSDQLVTRATSGYVNSVSRYWAGGLNASLVDPDSLSHNQASAPGASFTTAWGWGKFFIGANFGAVNTNRQAAALGNLNSGTMPTTGSNAIFATQGAERTLYAGAALQGLDRKGRLVGGSLALPSQYGDGYGVLGLDFALLGDTFPLRIGLHAMSYLNDDPLNLNGPSRKEISGIVDLGWNKNFGLSLGVNKSFIGYDRHSLGVFFNDLGGSGFDVQFGLNLATRGLFNLADLAAGNFGFALGIPLLDLGAAKDQIKLILAARQSLGDNFGASTDVGAPNQAFKDSGLTLSLPYQHVAGTPLSIRAEYSMLLSDALWASRLVAHDLSLVTGYSF